MFQSGGFSNRTMRKIIEPPSLPKPATEPVSHPDIPRASMIPAHLPAASGNWITVTSMASFYSISVLQACKARKSRTYNVGHTGYKGGAMPEKQGHLQDYTLFNALLEGVQIISFDC